MRTTFITAATALAMFSFAEAHAQEGCVAARRSCTQMNAECERVCQTYPNVNRCITASCSVALPKCQSTGVWNVRGTATCWKTSNRS